MESLTPTQKEAVESEAKATLIIAGPGTGKTRLIASRVVFLIQEKKIQPEKILALTYTEAGAAEMKKRIISFLKEDGYKVNIMTFHAFSKSLIDENPDIFGYKRDVRQLDEVDKELLIKTVIDKLYKKRVIKYLSTKNDKYYYRGGISKNLSHLKKEGISPEQYEEIVKKMEEEFKSIPDEEKMSARKPGEIKGKYKDEEKRINKNKELYLIYKEYETQIKNQNAYDYEDMINKASLTLWENKEFLEKVQNEYDSILADEYQDTNGAQNKILFALLNRDEYNCFVVGDDDQAIHRFQGATTRNFLDFTQKFPDAKIISLKDNFRSPQLFLDSALNFIKENETRITNQLNLPDKTLFARGKTALGKEYSIVEFETDIEERAFIVEQIQDLLAQNIPPEEIAILTRTNAEQKPLSEALRAYNIPYYMSGSQGVLQNPVIISLFNIVAACQNPRDNQAFISFLRHPSTPISPEDALYITAKRRRGERESLYDSFTRALKEKSLTKKYEADKALNILTELYEAQEVMSASNWLHRAIEKTGFLTWVLKQDNSLFLLENIKALCFQAEKEQSKNPAFKIRDLITRFSDFRELGISIRPEESGIFNKNAVRLLTAHQAKGQEFEYVFIINNTEGVWSKTKKTPKTIKLPEDIAPESGDQEDNRRLFYVALTRAKKGLFITYALKHSSGQGKQNEKPPSLFIESISKSATTQQKEPSDKIREFIEKTTIITAPPEYTKNNEEIIKDIINSPSFSLSATGLIDFIKCPLEFLYKRVLKAPTEKNLSLVYGIAIHYALQRYFEEPKENRSLGLLIQSAKYNIETRSLLAPEENDALIEQAKESLTKYYKTRIPKEPEPIFVEKNYSGGNITFNNIPLSGKIDKISPMKDSANEVKIVDYKTGQNKKTSNEILGLTKSADKNTPELRQLMFYKLLLLLDKSFQYTPSEFAIDYVETLDEVAVKIDNEQYEEFKKELEEIWENIQSLNFLKPTEKFPFCGECAYCKNG